jgi:EAL domain-containing protein (putative c-di-GMP-specific phosphodiesterase class I)
VHILSAIPDHEISDPIYVPERHTDTQAEGVCALIAIAHETTGEVPAHGGAPALLQRAEGSARAAGLSPAAPALSAVPRVQAVSAVPGAPAVSAVPGAQAVSAPPAGRAGPALLDDPLGQAPRTLDGARATGEPRPRRRLAGREGKHRRPPVPPGVGMLAPSAVMGEHPAGPGGARRGLDAELETSLLNAVVTADAPPRPSAGPAAGPAEPAAGPPADLGGPDADDQAGRRGRQAADRTGGPGSGRSVRADSRPGPRLSWPIDPDPGSAGPAPGRPVAHAAPSPGFGTVFQPVVDLASDVTVGFQAMVSVAGRWAPGSRAASPEGTGADVAMEGALARAAMSVAPVLPGRCWLAAEVSMRLLAADPILVNGIGALARQVVLVLQQPAVADLDASLWWLLGRLPANVSLAIGDARPNRETMNILAKLRPAYLRIEREAVARVEHDRARQRHIAAMVADAQKYGSKVVAAGIETPQERDVLCRLGVHGGVYAGV